MIKYKNNINVGTGSVGYEADATSAAPADSVSEGRIVKSEGRTVKWNQLMPSHDGINLNGGTYSNGEYITNEVEQGYEGNKALSLNLKNSYQSPISGNDKILLKFKLRATNSQITKAGVYFFAGDQTAHLTTVTINDLSDTYKTYSFIITAKPSSYKFLYFQIRWQDFGTVPATFQYYLKEDVQVINLTSIFGAGNEPSTVEAFESWLAENMVEQDYYAYDAGSLVPVMVKGVKRDVGGTTVTNPMPVTTLKDENDVVMFPDGLKSAGSVKDEIDWEHGVAVKRVGVVDLGELSWTLLHDSLFYSNELESPKLYGFAVCSYFSVLYGSAIAVSWDALSVVDKSIAIQKSGNNKPRFGCNDSTYSDAASFKSAMQGVLLYYELATPVTYHFATHAELKKRVVKIGESVEVDGIEGETVVWNQLVQNGDFSNGISSWVLRQGNSTALSTSDGLELVCTSSTSSYPQIKTQDKIFIAGHKYYITLTAKKNNCPITGIRFRQTNSGWSTEQSTELMIEVSQTYTKAETIITAVDNYEYFGLLALNATNDDDNRWYVKNVQVIDLTLMFGSGNEPATVAEFESWLSAHGGIEDYYPYCAGELKDKEEGYVRGVGFNLWKIAGRTARTNYTDWGARLQPHPLSESEYLVGVSADDYFGSAQILNYSVSQDKVVCQSRNGGYGIGFPVKVFPNTYYYLTFDGSTDNYPYRIGYYDIEGKYISDRSQSGHTFNTPVNCYWVVIVVASSQSAPTVATNMCFNLSDASRNGTYVPYKSITRSVDLTTLKGKVNGAGEDVVMFPDGMKQAGSVKDEIFVEGGVVKAVKRVGTVDLGELTWEYGPNYATPIFLSGRATIGAAASNANVLCAIYKALAGFWQFSDKDMCIAIGGSYLNISNSAYTSAADFTTAMQGVMLNYELDSPVTYVVNMQGMEMAEVRKVMVGTQKVWEMSV